MKILYIHRSKGLGDVSIEKVFDIMTTGLPTETQFDKYYVPCHRANPFSILKNIIAVKKYVKSNKYDVYHIVGDLHYLTLAISRKKSVLTIHDLVGTVRFKGLKKGIYIFFWVLLPAIKCKHIVAITEFTRQDIIKYCPWLKNKIEIIPSAVSNDYVYSDKKFNEKKPHFLVVGTRTNKNVDRIIDAITDMECVLDIVGPLSETLEKKLQNNSIEYTNGVRLSETELINRYKQADIVLFPSIYEGQGVIILEAQKIGRPVITSNIEPMISVSGGATCLVNPYDVEDIRRGIQKIVSDEHYREKLISLGLKNIKAYEAPVLATQYIKIYDEIQGDRK